VSWDRSEFGIEASVTESDEPMFVHARSISLFLRKPSLFRR
jgi:hypothetical protein